MRLTNLPIQALLGLLCFVALIHAELDCRKYPFYYRCRGISAKRSFIPYAKMEASSFKNYGVDNESKERRTPPEEAVLAWISENYGDDALDSYNRLPAADVSYDRKGLY